MGSWRDKKVWAFTAVISRAWLTTGLWLWQASTLLPPAETASRPDYSTLTTQRSIILGEKQRDVSQQQAETTKENCNMINELHLLWCPATAEPHETQGSSCGSSVGLLQVCNPAAQEQKRAAKSGVFSKELMYRRVVATQIHFTKRAESALCHDRGSGVPVWWVIRRDRHQQEPWNHCSQSQHRISWTPGENIYKTWCNTLVCIKSRNKFPLIAHCRMKESTESFPQKLLSSHSCSKDSSGI